MKIIIGNGCSSLENREEVDAKILANMFVNPIAVEAKRVGKIILFATNTTVNDIAIPKLVRNISTMKVMLS